MHKSARGLIEFSRADLVDRNGELLARDLPVSDLYARPHAFWDRQEAAHDLAQATGADERRLAGDVQRQASLRPHRAEADARRAGARDATRLPGLDFVPSVKRYYPDGRATAQVLGVTSPDKRGEDQGVSGLEAGLNPRLLGGKPGEAVQLSLDMRVQYILAHEVEASREEFSAKQAGGIVLDVRTGEVLAMVSLPDFDPNMRTLSDGDTTHNVIGQDVYELGSVFKIFSFALAMEDHTTTPDEIFADRQRLQDRQVHDPRGRAHAGDAGGARYPRPILQHRHDADRAAFRPDAPGTVPDVAWASFARCIPNCPKRAGRSSRAHWGTIETATISFGHGISVSPLAFAAAAATVVNGGRRITPTFLKHPEDAPRRTGHQARNQREDARTAALCRDRRNRQEGRCAGL